jgi:RimJ/RimL family protein N-acetyltransferase
MSNFIITTARLGLRNWQPTDSEEFAKINADERVMQYFPSCLSSEETLALMERIQKHFEDYGYGLYAVEYLANNQLIGFIGLSHPRFEADFTPCVEIGWRLAADYWRMGLAYEGALACLEYGFNTLQLSEVYSFTALSNTPSENLMKKLGLKKIGEFDHPNLPIESHLRPHHLYKIEKKDFHP